MPEGKGMFSVCLLVIFMYVQTTDLNLIDHTSEIHENIPAK